MLIIAGLTSCAIGHTHDYHKSEKKHSVMRELNDQKLMIEYDEYECSCGAGYAKNISSASHVHELDNDGVCVTCSEEFPTFSDDPTAAGFKIYELPTSKAVSEKSNEKMEKFDWTELDAQFEAYHS